MDIGSVEPEYFMLKGPLFPPASEVNRMVGRLVRNFAQPTSEEYYPEDASTYRMKEYSKLDEMTLGSASRFASNIKHAEVQATFLSPFEGHKGNFSSQKAWLESTEIQVFELRQFRTVFDRLKAQAEVRKKLDAWRKLSDGKDRHNVLGYMITGVLTMKNATVVTQDSAGRNMSGSAKLPIAAAGSAAIAGTTGIVIDQGVIGDVGFRIDQGHSSTIIRTAHISDDHVFAVKCLSIRRFRPSLFAPATYEVESRGPRIPENRKYGPIYEEALDTTDTQQKDITYQDEYELEDDSVPWTDVINDIDETVEVLEDVVQCKNDQKIRLVTSTFGN